jgi:hypothetical protein
MPPSLPSGTNRAVAHPVTGLDRIVSLLDMEGFGLALAANDFEQQEWVERILRIVRDADPKVSLGGLKELRATIMELAKFQSTKVEERRERADGNMRVSQIASTRRLLDSCTKPVLMTVIKDVPDGQGPQVIRPLIHRDDGGGNPNPSANDGTPNSSHTPA